MDELKSPTDVEALQQHYQQTPVTKGEGEKLTRMLGMVMYCEVISGISTANV